MITKVFSFHRTSMQYVDFRSTRTWSGKDSRVKSQRLLVGIVQLNRYAHTLTRGRDAAEVNKPSARGTRRTGNPVRIDNRYVNRQVEHYRHGSCRCGT